MGDWSSLIGAAAQQRGMTATEASLLQNQAMQNMYRSCSQTAGYYPSPLQWAGAPQEPVKPIIKPKGKGVFAQISNDVKSFIVEHRSIIYFVAAAILIDHFLFKGVFRERLQSVADRLVKRVEDKVAEVTK